MNCAKPTTVVQQSLVPWAANKAPGWGTCCWSWNWPIQHRPGQGGWGPEGQRHLNPPSATGGSGSPRTCQQLLLPSLQPPHAAALFSCHLSTRVKVKTQYNANSAAQYPIHRTAIHQMVRDKKHKRFSINVETKMNINFQSSTKTMGSRETDITSSPYSIRLGSHLPQTPIANLDLKDKSSCRRALPLSCPLMPLLKMLLQFLEGGGAEEETFIYGI